MGKKNKVKHLLGRFNVETNCELKALPYSLDDVVCEMLLKVDLKHANSLTIANVPYYLDEVVLKQLISSSLGTDVVEVILTTSTALHGNLKRGYRSGRLVFSSIHARCRAFDSINEQMCPFKLEKLGVKLPAWHKPITNRYRKRKYTEETEGMEISAAKASEVVGIDQSNKDGWINVTRKHKFSFRGTINRLDGGHANFEETERIKDELHNLPKREKQNQ